MLRGEERTSCGLGGQQINPSTGPFFFMGPSLVGWREREREREMGGRREGRERERERGRERGRGRGRERERDISRTSKHFVYNQH